MDYWIGNLALFVTSDIVGTRENLEFVECGVFTLVRVRTSCLFICYCCANKNHKNHRSNSVCNCYNTCMCCGVYVDFASNPVVVFIFGTLLVVNTDGSVADDYYCAPVCIENGLFHTLCSHIDTVVDHKYNGTVSDFLCVIYGWEAYVQCCKLELNVRSFTDCINPRV